MNVWGLSGSLVSISTQFTSWGTFVRFTEMAPVCSEEPGVEPELPESGEEHAMPVAIESAAVTPNIQSRG
jgi:hypothetical protein